MLFPMILPSSPCGGTVCCDVAPISGIEMPNQVFQQNWDVKPTPLSVGCYPSPISTIWLQPLLQWTWRILVWTEGESWRVDAHKIILASVPGPAHLIKLVGKLNSYFGVKVLLLMLERVLFCLSNTEGVSTHLLQCFVAVRCGPAWRLVYWGDRLSVATIQHVLPCHSYNFWSWWIHRSYSMKTSMVYWIPDMLKMDCANLH